MSDRVNSVVKKSLLEACANNGEGENVAKMICAWIEAKATSDVAPDEHRQHANVVVNAISAGETHGD